MFLISPRKHTLWYSLEAPWKGTSNEYPHLFSRNKKKKYYVATPFLSGAMFMFAYLTGFLKGVVTVDTKSFCRLSCSWFPTSVNASRANSSMAFNLNNMENKRAKMALYTKQVLSHLAFRFKRRLI